MERDSAIYDSSQDVWESQYLEVRCHKKASSLTPIRSAIGPPPRVPALIGGKRDGRLLWLVGGGWRVWASGLEPFSAVCLLWHKWTAGLSQSRNPVTVSSHQSQCLSYLYSVWRVTCDVWQHPVTAVTSQMAWPRLWCLVTRWEMISWLTSSSQCALWWFKINCGRELYRSVGPSLTKGYRD